MSRRILAGLVAIAAVLALSASASATTVSPQKQAILDRHGWTATDDDAYSYGDGSTAYSVPAGVTGGCAHSAARRVGSALRYASGNPMVRGAIKLAVCGDHGRITARNCVYRHASPGRYWRADGIGASTGERWDHRAIVCLATYRWSYGNTYMAEFSRWYLDLEVRAWVVPGTDHKIRFSVKRHWE
jgi:hypothetical protein